MLLKMTKIMRKLSEVKCRLSFFFISPKWHIIEIFKVEIHVRNGTADVSKTMHFSCVVEYIVVLYIISHNKILHYRFFIGITVNNYNLPRSLKGVYMSLSYIMKYDPYS